VITWRHWSALIGPGVLMVGSNIGGGEWLFGPIVTAQYGGQLMWLATLSIGFQIFYNLSVMRYTLATGEPIFVGFLRTRPGP
jgi:Mn2+/Fe2+ NRAMP family transporter